MAAANLLNLKRLVSACVHLARRGGHIIRAVHREGQLGAHNKLDGDTRGVQAMDPAEVLTIADTQTQNFIVTSLRAMFPGIRLVGEEEEAVEKASNASETPARLEDVTPLEVPFEVPSALAESLTLADTCLWIDPLDGTIEFVRGNLHNVCILIGVAVCDRPVAGIVFQPYVGGEKGTMTYGAVGVGVFGDRVPAFGGSPEELVVAMEPKHAANPRIQLAMSHLDMRQPSISQAAGQNLLRVLRGEVSVFVQASGASRWDTCAGEALLMAVGGKVTDLDGNPYFYLQGAASYLNSEGLIAARSSEVHARVALAFAKEHPPLGDTVAEPEKKRTRIDAEK